jgi:hypothetical protein
MAVARSGIVRSWTQATESFYVKWLPESCGNYSDINVKREAYTEMKVDYVNNSTLLKYVIYFNITRIKINNIFIYFNITRIKTNNIFQQC